MIPFGINFSLSFYFVTLGIYFCCTRLHSSIQLKLQWCWKHCFNILMVQDIFAFFLPSLITAQHNYLCSIYCFQWCKVLELLNLVLTLCFCTLKYVPRLPDAIWTSKGQLCILYCKASATSYLWRCRWKQNKSLSHNDSSNTELFIYFP